MISSLLILAAAVAAPESVRCTIGEAPPRACGFSDRLDARGVHHMVFAAGRTHIAFVGRSQSGWWSGTLDGRPAMGYERNRGHIVFSTTDLKTRFAWWYPADEHGTY